MGPKLLGDVVNPPSNWFLKTHIFSSTLSAQEKNFNKNLSSARVTVKCVFGILKGR